MHSDYGFLVTPASYVKNVKIMKAHILIFLIFLMGHRIEAHGIKVSGKVYSDLDKTPLFGVNVVLKGTMKGTTTDKHGEYVITVPSPAVSIGF